jgi:hypothetical protein
MLQKTVAIQPNLVRNDFDSLMRVKPVRSNAFRQQYLLGACEKFCGASRSSPGYYTDGWLISVSQFVVSSYRVWTLFRSVVVSYNVMLVGTKSHPGT